MVIVKDSPLTKVDINDPAVRKIAAYKCLDSLLFQTRLFFRMSYRMKFGVNHHHEQISEVLEKVLRGEITRLIINMPPRYGKTEMAVKGLIAHGLALNAAAKFIHLSYSDTLALDNSEAVKDLVQSDSYQALFPHVQIKKDSQAKKKWFTTEGGGVYATAAAGQVTGFGAGIFDADEEKRMLDDAYERLMREDNELAREVASLDKYYEDDEDDRNYNVLVKQKFGGAIIIDDPIKPDDADSAVVRDRVNNRYDSTIKNRVNSRRTPIIIIMQRLHKKDLCGHLIDRDGEQWTVLSLPAIMHVNEDGQLIERPLWEEKHTLAELHQMKKENGVEFGRQYMQKPMPKEGLMFPLDDLQYFNRDNMDFERDAEYSLFYGDPADTGGDQFAGPLGKLIGNKVYITDVVCNTKGIDFNTPRIEELIVQHEVHAVEIEGNSAWKFPAMQLREQVVARHEDCNFRIIKNTKNKETRIFAQHQWIINNCVFDADYASNEEYAKFMEILGEYLIDSKGKNQVDDPPDAMAGLAVHFRKNFSHLWIVKIKREEE